MLLLKKISLCGFLILASLVLYSCRDNDKEVLGMLQLSHTSYLKDNESTSINLVIYSNKQFDVLDFIEIVESTNVDLESYKVLNNDSVKTKGGYTEVISVSLKLSDYTTDGVLDKVKINVNDEVKIFDIGNVELLSFKQDEYNDEHIGINSFGYIVDLKDSFIPVTIENKTETEVSITKINIRNAGIRHNLDVSVSNYDHIYSSVTLPITFDPNTSLSIRCTLDLINDFESDIYTFLVDVEYTVDGIHYKKYLGHIYIGAFDSLSIVEKYLEENISRG